MFHINELRKALKHAIVDKEVSIEQAAIEMNVVVDDLKAFEQDNAESLGNIPDAITVGSLIDWLGVDARTFFNQPVEKQEGIQF